MNFTAAAAAICHCSPVPVYPLVHCPLPLMLLEALTNIALVLDLELVSGDVTDARDDVNAYIDNADDDGGPNTAVNEMIVIIAGGKYDL